MATTKLNLQDSTFAESFVSLFSSPVDSFMLNLSGASLIEVLRQHEANNARKNPKYNHKSVINLICEIEDMSGGRTIMPNHVNSIFYDYLLDYIINGKGLQPSTAECYFGQISSALGWAAKYGAIINPSYNDYTVKYNPRAKIALTIEEICTIYYFDLRKLTKTIKKTNVKLVPVITECVRNGKPYKRTIIKKIKEVTEQVVPVFSECHLRVLEQVRDMFILSCMLFQRYSDMKNLNPDNFSADKMTYKTIQQKTGSIAVVDIKSICPSPDIAFEILKKYNYCAPYNKDINNYNKHLHELINIIGGRFDDDVVFEDKQFGEIRKVVKKLRECITSHTARRTAITLSTKTNNEFKIRRASGHKDGRSFARYVCYDK